MSDTTGGGTQVEGLSIPISAPGAPQAETQISAVTKAAGDLAGVTVTAMSSITDLDAAVQKASENVGKLRSSTTALTAAQKANLDAAKLSLDIAEARLASGQNYLMQLDRMVATYNMATDELQRYKAVELGVSQQAETRIAQMKAMADATAQYGVAVKTLEGIDEARLQWEKEAAAQLNGQRVQAAADQIKLEESSAASLQAQRIRALDDQAKLEESSRTALNAQRIRDQAANRAAAIKEIEEMEAARVAAIDAEESRQAVFNAFKIRTLNENRAEALRILTEQEQAAAALAEKQAIEEIKWNALSVKSRIAQLEQLKAYQEAGISGKTINSTFSSAAIADLPQLAQYQKTLDEVDKSHGKVTKSGEAMGVSFNNNRVRTEALVLTHEALQGRLTRMFGSFMTLAEYANASSLAFSGFGLVTLGVVAAVAATAYEMTKGAEEVYKFNNALVLTGGYTGMTRDSMEALAQTLKGDVHQQIGTATEMLVALNATGKFSGDTLASVADAALKFQKLSGQSTSQVVGMFNELGAVHGKVFNDMQNKIADWAAKANESYHFLSASQYEHIRLLALEGNNQEAVTEISQRMTESFDKESEAIKNQDKNVGYLTATYLGFKMILQDIGHALQDWGKTDTTGQLLEAAKRNLKTTEEAANKYASENDAHPNAASKAKWTAIAALYAKQTDEVIKLQKKFNEEQDAADKQANEKRVDEEGVYGQREVDSIRKIALRKTALADNYIEHLMEGAAKANASAIQEWEKQYKGDAAHHDADMQAAIKNGTLKVETEESLQDTILKIRARYHDKALNTANDGRKQELLDQLNADDQAFKMAQEAADHSMKMAKDFADQKQSSRQSEYEAVTTAYMNELRALDAMEQAKLATLAKYKPKNETDAKENIKRINDVTRAYQLSAAEIHDAMVKSQQDVVGKAVKEVSTVDDKQINALQTQIENQKKYNAEIGKTLEQKKISQAALDDQAILDKQVDLVYQQSIADNEQLGVVQRAVAAQKAKDDQTEIDQLKQKRDLEAKGATLAAQAAVDKQWAQMDKKIGDDLASAIVDGGGKGYKKLIRDMELAFAKMILQPIIAPIAAGFSSIFNPTATQAGGVGAAGAGNGAGAYISAANAASNAYNGVSNGFAGGAAMVGGGITSAGMAMGSSSVTGFGMGASGAAGVVTELGQGTATGSVAAGDISAAGSSAAGAGATAASAGTIAAGVVGGLIAGHMISGQFKVADSSNAAPVAGTAIGAGIGWYMGGVAGAAIGAFIGGAAGGLVNRIFGMGDKNVTSTGIRGTISDSGTTGDNYSTWHQEGGWLRSNRDGTDTSAMSSDELNSFNTGLTTMKSTMDGLVGVLGVGTSALDNYSKSFDILVKPLAEVKGTAAQQAQIIQDNQKLQQENAQAITTFFTSVGDDMATKLVPNIQQFSLAGETASQTLTRLNATFTETNNIAAMLGKTSAQMFGSAGLSSDSVRENLINMAGGSSNLSQYMQNYSTNFLTKAQQIAPTQQAVADAMSKLGLASVKTREQFADTVSALDLTKASDQQMFISLMQLSSAFATVTPQIKDTTLSLTDAQNQLNNAYQTQLDAIKTMQTNMTTLGVSLRQFESSNLLGNLSPLTPQEQYAEAKSQYDKTLTAAENGDANAQSNYQTAYQSFLTASRTVNSSGSQYQQDFQYAQAMTDQLAKYTDGQQTVAQQQLDVLNKQVGALVDINNSVVTVTDAIKTLQEAMGLKVVTKSVGPMVRPDSSATVSASLLSQSAPSNVTLRSASIMSQAQPASGSDTSSLLSAVQALQAEIVQLRLEQQQQTGDLLANQRESVLESAEQIADATVSVVQMINTRVQPA